ncbi:hypothetical protein LRP88_04025 [Fusarium phalaenopsidis]
MLLGQETTATLRETIDAYTQRPNGIPGLVYIVVDRDGRYVFAYASGKRGLGELEDMTLDTTFWIASCTKLVTTIAAMHFSNRKLKKWFEPVGINEFDDQDRDVYTQPLVNQPGSAWEYGIGIDWAGRLVERMSGLSLDDYYSQVFQCQASVERKIYVDLVKG